MSYEFLNKSLSINNFINTNYMPEKINTSLAIKKTYHNEHWTQFGRKKTFDLFFDHNYESSKGFSANIDTNYSS